MSQKVVVFSQIDPVILEKLKAQYQVVCIDPKQGDVNEQIRNEVQDADGPEPQPMPFAASVSSAQ